MATISITIPDTAIPKLKEWVDFAYPFNELDENGIPRTRTNAEYLATAKEAIKEFLRASVRGMDERKAHEALRASLVDIEVQD
jgi:hypothetical protein